MHPAARRNTSVVFVFGLAALALSMSQSVSAETPAQVCDRLAADTVSLDSLDGTAAQTACSSAVTAAPTDSKLQYEYARALERSGKADQAKQLYQWLAADNFSPAVTALQRVNLPSSKSPRTDLVRRFRAVAELTKRIADATPVDHDDPKAILSVTGSDPQSILAWVKANTHIVPYAGMLRGPTGVLSDRAGNSLDRALFLADLLHRAGLNARIARQQLSDASANALLLRLDSPWPPSAQRSDEKKTLMSAIGSVPELDKQLIERVVDGAVASQLSATRAVSDLSSKVLPPLLQLLEDDPQRNSEIGKSAVALLKDHFWVQLQNGGVWQNLDPDADVVGPLVATQTFLPQQLPAELAERVTITLTIEALANGKLTETPVLSSSALPSELAGASLTIIHNCYPRPIPAANNNGTFAKTLLTNLSGVAAILPGILVNGRIVAGQLFSFDGKVAAATSMNLASMGGTGMVNSSRLANGIASVFSDSTPAPATSPATSRVIAEWLDIEISAPGQAVRRERRAIFDLIGANKRVAGHEYLNFSIDDQQRLRRALALLGTVDLWIAPNAPTSSSVTRLTNQRLSSAAANAADALLAGKDLVSIEGGDPVNPAFLVWNNLRQQADTPLVFDRPNIALVWRKLLLRPDRSIASQVDFDIVENGVFTDTLFKHRVAQGVRDTAAEYVTLKGARATRNVAAAFAADLDAHRNWSLVTPGGTSKAAVSPATLARIAAATSLHDLAIAPQQPAIGESPGSNWWRVKAEGNTLGIGIDGKGVAVTEEAVVQEIPLWAARSIRLVGCAASVGFSVAMDMTESGPPVSVRTAAEGLVCVVGGWISHTTAPYGTEVAGTVFNIGYTLLTTPPPDGEKGGAPPPGNQSPSEPNTSYQPAPVCTDDGC